MLLLTIPEREVFNEETSTILVLPAFTAKLEHSLISISSWEARWEKPFLSKKHKSEAERISYIYDMCINKNYTDEQILSIAMYGATEIEEYINAKRTATKIKRRETSGATAKVVTSELIYFWMTHFRIPFECQKWHLNRLLTLIDIANVETSPKQKMTKAEIYARNKQLNKERRERLLKKKAG